MWIENLDRDGLGFQEKEKQILFWTTAQEEKLLIQYPGKETVPNSRRRARPWDFRPKLQRACGEYERDLSFKDIWDILIEAVEGLSRSETIYARALATVFYRMAFMCDHQAQRDGITYQVRTLSFRNGGTGTTESPLYQEPFFPFYAYSLPSDVLRELSEVFNDLGNMSLDAFLRYNELLAWNEDCKYHFRSVENEKGWIQGIGRVNNLLTHISVIGFALGDVKLSDMLMRFVRMFGVSPATWKEIRLICGDFLDLG